MKALSYKRLYQLAIDFMEAETKRLKDEDIFEDRERIILMECDMEAIKEYLGFVMKNNK
jgi:hypothetical protein